MSAFSTPFVLAQAMALASSTGISIYATVAGVGLAARAGWIDRLPAGLEGLTSGWVLAIAGALAAVELLASLVPGVASAWETAHAAIRPIAGAALAAATAWHADPPVALIAALLGGSVALGTSATKLGLRYTIDASPEPFTNGAATTAELGLIATVAALVWNHPFAALAIALVAVVLTALLVRTLWRTLRRAIGRLVVRD